MLQELNKNNELVPGYDHYYPDYDMDDTWNNDRYYNGGQRYKVNIMNIIFRLIYVF